MFFLYNESLLDKDYFADNSANLYNYQKVFTDISPDNFDDLSSWDENNKGLFVKGSYPQIKEEKSTGITDINIQIPINCSEKYKNYIPKVYTFEDILLILKDNDIKISNIIKEEIENNQKFKEIEKSLLTNNRKRKYGDYNEEDEKYNRYSKGRKKKSDSEERKHNKTASDNIIKKIKAKLSSYLLKFINNMISKKILDGKNKLIKKFNYKTYTDSLNRDQNLNDLQKTLSDILSNDISTKYLKYSNNWNKNVISSILEEYQNDNFIKFVFSMTYVDWIDIFLLKKNVRDINCSDIKLNETEYKEFEEYVPKVENLLDKVLKDNDNEYLSHFILYLYNYERWFYNKKGRKRRKKSIGY
jgi:hypothetical protein